MIIKNQKELNEIVPLKHLTFSDIRCKHCGTFELNQKRLIFLMLIEHFQNRYGKQKINSFYRCPTHQINIKKQELGKKTLTKQEEQSALDSGHCLGLAIDIGTNNPKKLLQQGIEFDEFLGLGIYPWGCHFDIKPRKAFWQSAGGKYTYYGTAKHLLEAVK